MGRRTADMLGAFALSKQIDGRFRQALRSVTEHRVSFEQARNVVRKGMHTMNPTFFPFSLTLTLIDRIASILLPSRDIEQDVLSVLKQASDQVSQCVRF